MKAELGRETDNIGIKGPAVRAAVVLLLIRFDRGVMVPVLWRGECNMRLGRSPDVTLPAFQSP